MNFLSSLRALVKNPFGPRTPAPQPPHDQPTAGPSDELHPPIHLGAAIDANFGNAGSPKGTWVTSGTWENGWWSRSDRAPAHQGRIGPTIVPVATVVHTTDTLDGFQAIKKSWTTTPGYGNAATFMIGRTPSDGVVQFCPITRNSNHAGGTPHGWWKWPSGSLVHPNTMSVGIEIVAGGLLKVLPDGSIIHPDTGRKVEVGDVWWDPHGHPWHRVTDYQLETLRSLVADLRACYKPMPAGVTIAPDGRYLDNGVPWATGVSPDLVGHVTLDPVNKTDPGPQVMMVMKGWQ